MKKAFLILAILPVFIVIIVIANNKQVLLTDSKQIAFEITKSNYIEYCAGCHGYMLEKFVKKNEWLYGTTTEDLFNNIKNGQEEIGMPSFKATFNDEEIRNLTNYIISSGIQSKYDKTFIPVKEGDINITEKQKFRVDTIVTGLEIPWGMAWLPNGDMLITERSGILYRYSDGKLHVVNGTPEVYQYGQGGLLDIELHPKYNDNGWIYISYSYYAGKTIEDGGSTAIMRCRLKDDILIDKEILFKAVPAEKKGPHYGSRLEFDQKGYLYFSVGDRGQQENAQSIYNHSGCLHRIYDDGRIPEDNPFVNVQGAMPTIYNYGHRNIQGLGIYPQTNELWSHEHGPKGGDEINIEKIGKNYGWPEISFGVNYDGTIITEDTAKNGMEQPITYWIPSIAPCGMDFIEGGKYKNWEGNLLVGSLRFKYVERCEIENNKVVHQEKLLEGIGRVRNVKVSSDGYIYVAIELPGKILKLIPVN